MTHLTPNPSRNSQHSGQRGGTLMGICVGIVLGAIIVAGSVYLFHRGDTHIGPASRNAKIGPSDSGTDINAPTLDRQDGRPVYSASEAASETKNNSFTAITESLTNGHTAPVTLPAVNPEQTETPAIAQPAAAPDAKAASKPMKPTYLQVGAFGKPEQADNLKARLALASVGPITLQRVVLTDGSIVHRVRVGPFSKREDITAMTARLKTNGLEPIEFSN